MWRRANALRRSAFDSYRLELKIAKSELGYLEGMFRQPRLVVMARLAIAIREVLKLHCVVECNLVDAGSQTKSPQFRATTSRIMRVRVSYASCRCIHFHRC